MTEALWQALLLVAGAFFFGAVLGCGLKRRFYYGTGAKASPDPAAMSPSTAVTPDASQPKVEVAARSAPYGERFERVLSVKPSAPAGAEPARPEPVKVEPVKPPVQAAAVPAARPAVPSPAAAPVKVEEGGAAPSDDLTRILSIDPILQRRLKDLGIRRFEDVARLTLSDIKGLNETLGLKGRIEEENWVGQAQILATGGETYYSRRRDRGIPVPEAASPAALAPAVAAPGALAAKAGAPAAAPAGPSDVSHLRSVRSEALRGDDGARAFGSRNAGDVDDLKRIRGIGVLIEKKLNSLGITQYEQVANWTGADIERISRILDFKGRIEREHWIEQARILATGGQTEFSRRG